MRFRRNRNKFKYRKRIRDYFVVKMLVWSMRLAIVALLIDIGYLLHIWPDWDSLAAPPAPKSNFILAYEEQRRINGRTLPPLRWQPISVNVLPQHLKRAILVSEDIRFYQHPGVDLDAFKQVMLQNFERRSLTHGASTISQQTVKNLFLTSSRDPLRKWHELILALAMEYYLTKDQILGLYLNIAEFGVGIYGVEAAAQHYWKKSARDISYYQAIDLAASLPSPKKHNPVTQTTTFRKRVTKIRKHMANIYD